MKIPVYDKETQKIIVMAALIAFSCFLTVWFHLVLGTCTIFTHFIYIPVILAAFWWKRKGIVVAVLLAGVLIAGHLLFSGGLELIDDCIRASAFIAISIVVALLSERVARTEKVVRESHAELDQIFQTAADGMRVVDRDFNVLRMNEMFLKLAGIRREDAAGRKCYEVFPGPRCHTPGCALTRILAGEAQVTDEIEKERRDGSRVPCIVTATPFRQPDGALIGIVEDFRDITERKRAGDALQKKHEDLEAAYEEITATEEELRQNYDELNKTEKELRESERKYRGLVELLPQTVFELDDRGTITTVNPVALKSFGYTQEDLDGGLNGFDVIAPGDRDRARKNVQRVLNGELLGGIEYTALRTDGSTFPIIIYTNAIIRDMRPVGIRGILVDITDRKRAEEELRAAYENAKELVFIVNHSPAVAWLWKAEPGWPVEYVSDNIDSFGYTPDEFTRGKIPYASIIHPDDLPRVGAEVERYTQEGRSEFSYEYRIVTKSGDVRWVYDWTWVRRDEDGTATHYQGITLDITDRKLAEEWLKKFSEELEAKVAERTEALNKSLHEKEMLLKEIHHRVKNNLQIVASLLNLQSRQITDPATLAMFKESQNRVRAMALVHERLYRSEDISSIGLSDYVRFMGTNLFKFYGVTPATVRLEVGISDIRVDINRAIPLGLLINELLSNSLKHAFPSGRKGIIAVTGEKDAGTIRIIVQDDGTGIPESLDWKNTSSLGMQLVNSLTDQMEGTIELDRTAGTKFTIRIPVAQDVK